MDCARERGGVDILFEGVCVDILHGGMGLVSTYYGGE